MNITFYLSYILNLIFIFQKSINKTKNYFLIFNSLLFTVINKAINYNKTILKYKWI